MARRLIAACGLEWEPACLEFHRTERPVRTASVTQVRQPIYQRSVARWKNYEPRWPSCSRRLPLEDLLEALNRSVRRRCQPQPSATNPLCRPGAIIPGPQSFLIPVRDCLRAS